MTIINLNKTFTIKVHLRLQIHLCKRKSSYHNFDMDNFRSGGGMVLDDVAVEDNDFCMTNLLNSLAVLTGTPETLKIWSPMWKALYRTG